MDESTLPSTKLDRLVHFAGFLQEDMMGHYADLKYATNHIFADAFLEALLDKKTLPVYSKCQGRWHILEAEMINIADTMQRVRADIASELALGTAESPVQGPLPSLEAPRPETSSPSTV
jgi:hypothetical protein